MFGRREPRVPQAARFLFGLAGVAVAVTLLLAWRSPGPGTADGGEATGTATATPPVTPGERPTDGAGAATPELEPVREGAVAESEAGPIEQDGNVAAAGAPTFTMPLKEWSYVTDRFGADRGAGFIHAGIDLAVEGLENSPVYAACDGKVDASEFSYSYGNHVIVACGDGWTTLYAHLREIEVEAGDAVTSETELGRTGSSGFSTGEHLHFEIMLDGTKVNPEHYLDFKIPPGTPLSSGPLYFPGSSETEETPTPTPTSTPTPTDTPIPTATRPPLATDTPTPVTPTPKPTSTPTPTPPPPTPTATPTSPPFIPS